MRALALLAFMLLPLTVCGGEAVPTDQDPVQEKRAVQLGEELRCLVCQNQTIAESNAELAVDLRRQIREQLGQGKSDREIIDFMVQRYGDFVLYRPPFKTTTLMLWLGPLLLLLVGVGILVRNLRGRRTQLAESPLSQEEITKAEMLLSGGAEKDRG
jgi:cytochrome c-type biogenesis protein CcmH